MNRPIPMFIESNRWYRYNTRYVTFDELLEGLDEDHCCLLISPDTYAIPDMGTKRKESIALHDVFSPEHRYLRWNTIRTIREKLTECGCHSQTLTDTDEIPDADTLDEDAHMGEDNEVLVDDVSAEDNDEDAILCDGKRCGQGIRVVGNRYICPHNNLEATHPELVPDWDPDNEHKMCDYLPGSNAPVNWICSQDECGCHKWITPIHRRTGARPTGCPYCNGQKVCEHNNLEKLRPGLVEQWCPDNPHPMSSYKVFSGQIVKWKCKDNDQHVWTASIKDRTDKRMHGCPFCSNTKIDNGNNLQVARPDLKKEWHHDNPPMNSFAPSSGKLVKWCCNDNKQHVWIAAVCNRTRARASGCPHCASSRGYSIAQIEWLNKLEREEGIDIQHALKPEGEYKIKTIGKVDGYCKEINTVFEFHGSYWHGDPKLYDHSDINPTKKKTYGELYAKTMKRDQQIRDLGYTLVVRWESDASEDSDSEQSEEPMKIIRNPKKSANKKKPNTSHNAKSKKNIVQVRKTNK